MLEENKPLILKRAKKCKDAKEQVHNMFSYKAESAGMKVIKVDARDTTQECSSCHYIKKGKERLTLDDRIYHRNVCGMTIDRDINASINILHKATTLGQRESYAQGESVRPHKEAVLEELRTDKTHPLQNVVIA